MWEAGLEYHREHSEKHISHFSTNAESGAFIHCPPSTIVQRTLPGDEFLNEVEQSSVVPKKAYGREGVGGGI